MNSSIPWFRLLGAFASLTLITACGSSKEAVTAIDLSEATDLFSPIPSPAATADRVLARVGGADITQAELMREMNMLLSRFGGQIPPEQLAQMEEGMRDGAMENLIIKQLLLNEVKSQNILVSDEEVDELMARYTGQMPPGMDLDEQLALINMSMVEFRENLARELSVNKLLEQAVELSEPDEAAVNAFYEEHTDDYFAIPENVTASHILVNARTGSDEETRAAALEKIQSVRQQLLEGADFAELAAAGSDCPSSQQGGSLGSFGRGQMVPAFESAAFTQDIGVIGDVVETDFGYHIILVTARSEGGTQELDDTTRERIAEFLQGQGREEALRNYIDQLREQAQIEILP